MFTLPFFSPYEAKRHILLIYNYHPISYSNKYTLLDHNNTYLPLLTNGHHLSQVCLRSSLTTNFTYFSTVVKCISRLRQCHHNILTHKLRDACTLPYDYGIEKKNFTSK